MKKYKTKKGFLKALQNLAKTNPDKNLKGKNHVRCEISQGTYNWLNYFRKSNHTEMVYARRIGNYGRTIGSNDLYVCSPELYSLLEANKELSKEFENLYNAQMELSKLGF